MHKILLFGDITSTSQGKDIINTKGVFQELLKADGKDLEIYINTLGGECIEAFAIVDLLNDYKTKHNATIKTVALGECASAGVLLLLTGDIREVKDNCYPFIHNVWANYQGDARDFQTASEQLQKENIKIAQYYTERTGIETELALELMGADTSLSPEQCELLGFATSTMKEDQEAEKMVLVNSLKTHKQMTENKEKTLFNMIRNFFVNEKVVHTADGEELVFPELEANDNIEVGDTATIDGYKADGEIVTQDGDEITFTAGEVTEFIEAEETAEDIEEELEQELNQLDNQIIENLKSELNTLKSEVAELRNFKNKITSIESETTEVELKEVITNNSGTSNSADYLAYKRMQNRK